MAYSTPLTAISNAVLTAAQWNASMRDNMLETFPAKATAAGQIAVSTGVNSIAVRTPTITSITTSETFTPSASVFGDFTTVGPVVGPLTTGAKAIVLFGAQMGNSSAGFSAIMSYAVSGATTIAATGNNCIRNISSNISEANRQFAVDMPTLNPGSNTFTAKYTSGSGGAVTGSLRTLIVIPL